MKIGVTGSSGFVGRAVVAYLAASGHDISCIPRGIHKMDAHDILVHTGGLAHSPRATEFALQEANYRRTVLLADQAADAGVGRFVFISSIAAVAGNSSPLTPDATPNPTNAYGRSKASAEHYLLGIRGIDCIILRPPLVYGPGAKGNMGLLRKLALSRIPLPFGAIKNRRTLISLSNLASAIEYVVTKPMKRQIYHTTDPRDVSLFEIVSTIRAGARISPMLFSIRPDIMSAALRVVGQSSMAEQLFGDLLVDGSALRDEGWFPPTDPEQDLLAMGSAKQ